MITKFRSQNRNNLLTQNKMKVLVIGAGNMGLTYAEGMSKSELLNRNKMESLKFYGINEERTIALISP